MNEQQHYQFLTQLELAKWLLANQMEYKIHQMQAYQTPEITSPTTELPIGLQLDVDDVLNTLSKRERPCKSSSLQPVIVHKKENIPKEPEVAIHTYNMERVANEKNHFSNRRRRSTQRQIVKRERVGTIRNATGKQVHFFTYSFENPNELKQKRRDDDKCNIQ